MPFSGSAVIVIQLSTFLAKKRQPAQLVDRYSARAPISYTPQLGIRSLRCVFEVADVHVAGYSRGGSTTPGCRVGSPKIEEERRCGGGHCPSVMDDQFAVHVPVNIGGAPYNLEIVGICLVVSGDLGVLIVREALPVGAVHGVGLVSYLLHVDFRDRIGGVKEARCHRA